MPSKPVTVAEALATAERADKWAAYWYSKDQPEIARASERTAAAWRRIARAIRTRRGIRAVA